MWMSTRGVLLASLMLTALGLGACAAGDDGPGITGTVSVGSGGASDRDDVAQAEPPDPTPPPLQKPVLAGLIIVPDSFQLSSDPAATPSARSKLLTVMARMNTGQQFPTSVTWQAFPNGKVNVAGSTNAVSVVPGAAGGVVILTASSGSVMATASVLIVPRVLTVSGVSVSATTASLHAPDQVGASLPDLPHRTRLNAIVTMSDGSTTSDVTWSSTNEAIAVVDSTGLVTARAAGSAEIVATATQGTAYSARCALTVKAEGLVSVDLE